MASKFPKVSRINSLWSIFYSVIVLGVEIYILYESFNRYAEAGTRTWKETPGSDETLPGAFVLLLVLNVFVILSLPFFVTSCVIKVGNYANDGMKLGRDHALEANPSNRCRCMRKELIRRIWRHTCPTAQVLHIMAAFLLLLPETYIQATEIKHGYLNSDVAWRSDIDFVFPGNRPEISNLRSSSNFTEQNNSTYFIIPTAKPGASVRTTSHAMSVAYVNFAGSLIVYAVRYSAVLWYTNKSLCGIFVFTLIFAAINSLFSFCGFSVLFKIVYNRAIHINITASMNPGTICFAYIIGGFVLLISTVTVFEYAANYFLIHFKKTHKKYIPDSCVKQTVVVKSNCAGYAPHSFAMAALVAMAIFKGLLIYDMLSLYRTTQDHLLLSAAVLDITYMLSWILLWFFLTLKQEWRFVVLDYVPIDKPIFTVQGEIMRSKTGYINKAIDMKEKERPTTIGAAECTSSDSGMDMNGSVKSDDRTSLNLIPGDCSTSSSGEDTFGRDTYAVAAKNRRQRKVRMGSKVTFKEGSPMRKIAMETVPETSSSSSSVNTAADVHSPDRISSSDRYSDQAVCYPEFYQRLAARNPHNTSLSSDDLESNTSEPVTLYSSPQKLQLAARSNSCVEKQPRMGKKANLAKPNNFKSILKTAPPMNKTTSEDSGIQDIPNRLVHNQSRDQTVQVNRTNSSDSNEYPSITKNDYDLSMSKFRHPNHDSFSSTDTSTVDSGLSLHSNQFNVNKCLRPVNEKLSPELSMDPLAKLKQTLSSCEEQGLCSEV